LEEGGDRTGLDYMAGWGGWRPKGEKSYSSQTREIRITPVSRGGGDKTIRIQPFVKEGLFDSAKKI